MKYKNVIKGSLGNRGPKTGGESKNKTIDTTEVALATTTARIVEKGSQGMRRVGKKAA